MITERFQSLGNWGISFIPDAPQTLIDDIKFFGSIVITPQRVDPREHSDAGLKAMARYVGMVRRKDTTTREQLSVGGPGLLAWLGDENQRAYLYEVQRTYIDQSFGDIIDRSTSISAKDADRNDFRPAPPGILRDDDGNALAITAGFISSDAAFSGNLSYEQFFLITPREALERLIEYYEAAEYRVNNDGTIDIGLESELFTATPNTLIVRKGWGDDPSYMGVPVIDLTVNQDAKEWAHKVVVSRALDGTTVGLASSTAPPNDLVEGLDYAGSAITRVAYVNDPTILTLASAEAAAGKYVGELNDLTGNIQLTAADFNIEGEFSPGDTVYVYDPATGHVDSTQEAFFRGEVLSPKAVRVMGITWPVSSDMGVYYRDGSGNYTDLSDWVIPETSSSVTIEVGKARRAIRTDASIYDPPVVDLNTIPSAPAGLTVTTAAYELDTTNPIDYATVAWLRLTWDEVSTNTDGTVPQDRSHYEVQWVPGTQDWLGGYEGGYPTGYGSDQGFANFSLLPVGSWETASMTWEGGSTPVYTIEGLPLNTYYQVRVRAVDQHGNASGWTTTTSRTAGDTIAPSTPAAPTVTSNPYLIVVTHKLGVPNGGNWGLEGDLDHLNMYADTVSGFTASEATFKGVMYANVGNLLQQREAVGTFATNGNQTWYVTVTAVDVAGNESAPSDEANAVSFIPDIDDIVPNLIGINVVDRLPSNPETDKWYYLSTEDTVTPGGPYQGDALWSWSSNGFLNLTGGYARILHASGLNMTGDIELMVKLTAADWSTNQDVVAKWDTGEQSYKLSLSNSTGRLSLATSTTGSDTVTHESTADVPFSNWDTAWVKIALDVDDGASDTLATFSTSTDAADDYTAVTWTPLGSTVAAGAATSIYAGTADLTVGDGFTGQVFRVVILNGLAGTPAVNIDFTEQTPGTVTFTEGSINHFSVSLIGGSEIGGALSWDQESYPEDKVVASRVLAGAISAGAIKAQHIEAYTVTADRLAGGTLTLGDPTAQNPYAFILHGNMTAGNGVLTITAATDDDEAGVFIRNLSADHIESGSFVLVPSNETEAGVESIRSSVLDADTGFEITGSGEATFNNVTARGTLSSPPTVMGKIPYSDQYGIEWHGLTLGNLTGTVPSLSGQKLYPATNLFAAYGDGDSYHYVFRVGDFTSGIEYDSGLASDTGPGLLTIQGQINFSGNSSMGGTIDLPGIIHAPADFGDQAGQLIHHVTIDGSDPSFQLHSFSSGTDTRSRLEGYANEELTYWQKPVWNNPYRYMLTESYDTGMVFRNVSTDTLSGMHFYSQGRWPGVNPNWSYGSTSMLFMTGGTEDTPIVFHHGANLQNWFTQIVIDTEASNSQLKYFTKWLNRTLGSDALRFSMSYDAQLFIGNAQLGVPATPTAGGVLYVEAGALKYKGSSGTVTPLANA